MPKQSTSEKIIALLDKEDIAGKVKIYQEIKNYMAAKVTEHADHLEDEKNKYEQIKDKL